MTIKETLLVLAVALVCVFLAFTWTWGFREPLNPQEWTYYSYQPGSYADRQYHEAWKWERRNDRKWQKEMKRRWKWER